MNVNNINIFSLNKKYFKNTLNSYNIQVRDFFNKVTPDFSNYKQITQGEIGDCWLLGPICAMSKSTILRNYFKEHFLINDDRTYTIKCFNLQNIKENIKINGELYYLPAEDEYKADLLFAGQQQYIPENPYVTNELIWASLIEKAVAFMLGGYHSLDGGDPGTRDVKNADLGFYILTGNNVNTVMIDNTININLLKELLEKGAAITYTTKDNKNIKGKNKMKRTPTGVDKSGYNLLEDHVYMVDTISYDGTLSLYNPHGEEIHLSHNIAKLLPLDILIMYGQRFDILLPANISGGRRRRKTSK